MTSLFRRMRRMRTLMTVRLGPGAAILPKDIKRIHLDFAFRIEGGHRGPRKFWRNYLPSLKYHNPAVSMTVKRTSDQSADALLSVIYTRASNAEPEPAPDPSTPAPDTAPAAGVISMKEPIWTHARKSPAASRSPMDRVETIEMKHRTEQEIMDELFKLTGAIPVLPTPEDEEELRSLQDLREKSERDSQRSKEINIARRKEEDVLRMARGGILNTAS